MSLPKFTYFNIFVNNTKIAAFHKAAIFIYHEKLTTKVVPQKRTYYIAFIISRAAHYLQWPQREWRPQREQLSAEQDRR